MTLILKFSAAVEFMQIFLLVPLKHQIVIIANM